MDTKKQEKDSKEAIGGGIVLELSDNEFDDFVKNGAVIIDFYADWCMPCLMLAPIVEELASNYKKVKIARVNIDENKEKSKEYQVFTIPTLLFIKNGQVVDRTTGSVSYEAMEERIKKLL
jgi:thioredoxin 1